MKGQWGEKTEVTPQSIVDICLYPGVNLRGTSTTDPRGTSYNSYHTSSPYHISNLGERGGGLVTQHSNATIAPWIVAAAKLIPTLVALEIIEQT